jgi:hypothetical protein
MMIIKVLTFTMFLLLSVPTVAQSTNEEFSRLREHLNLPDTTSIKVSNSSALPANDPLKVYIATGLDIGVRDNYLHWLEKWNKKDGKKYGMVQITYNLSDADVILARYILREQTMDRPDVVSRDIKSSTDSYRMVPVYAYVIARRAGGLEVLWRYASTTTAAETKDSGVDLVNDFFKMIKDRGKSRKK